MKKVFALLTLALLVSGVLSAQVTAGGTAWVAVRQAALRSSTWFFASTRGNLEMGDQVTVLRINGSWAEVRSTANPSLNGWTQTNNLSGRLVAAPGPGTTATEVALAGRGFDRDVEDAYRAGGNINYADVDRMENVTVSVEELYRFMTEGRLNTGEPR
jgi:hypothetical protein